MFTTSLTDGTTPEGENFTSSEELIGLLKAYRQAIDVNIISSITDTKGIILHANEMFCEVSGYSREELLGQNHRIINSGYHPDSFFREMWETLRRGEVWRGEIRNKTKNGAFYWVDTVIIPVLDPFGRTKQYLSLRTLINEKKRAELERKEYIEKLQEILNITSHRVRAPLATCMGLIQVLETGKIKEEEEIMNLLQHVKGSAMELDQFIQDLTLRLHRLETKYKYGNYGD